MSNDYITTHPDGSVTIHDRDLALTILGAGPSLEPAEPNAEAPAPHSRTAHRRKSSARKWSPEEHQALVTAFRAERTGFDSENCRDARVAETVNDLFGNGRNGNAVQRQRAALNLVYEWGEAAHEES